LEMQNSVTLARNLSIISVLLGLAN